MQESFPALHVHANNKLFAVRVPKRLDNDVEKNLKNLHCKRMHFRLRIP